MTRRRLLVPLVLVLGVVLAVPAGAHTQIRRATPGPAETVEAPVDAVVLELLDPVLPTPRIEVTGPGGAPVAGLGQVELVGDDEARVDFDPLEPGDYQVDYAFVALDGDEQVSAYTFTVEAGDDGVAVRPLLAVLVGAVLVGLVVAALLGRRRAHA